MYKTLTESFRLSPQQRHLCALQQAEESFAYRTRCAVRLEGRLDVSCLCRALEQLVERYEILRTTFPRLLGLTLPVQTIGVDMDLPFVIHDCSSMPLHRQEEALLHLRETGRNWPLTLEEGPLWQVTLVICTTECHWLLWDLSALSADAETCHVLLYELSQLYAKGGMGEGGLGEPLQYADLAEWQYEWLELAEAAPGREFWHFLEHAELHAVSLPYELPTNGLSPFTPRSLAISLSPSELAQLKALAQHLNVAPAALLLACWGAVLSRLSAQTDLLIGTRYSGRNNEVLAEAVGLLAKSLPLPYQFLEDTRFNEVARQVEATMREAYKWQEYFGWEVFETLQEEGQEPFCPFGFAYERLPAPWQTGPLQWFVEEQQLCLDRFKVSLSCLENPRGMQITLSYDQGRFAQQDMQSLLIRWQTVLQQVLASSDVPLGTLQLLTYQEQRWLLQELNATQADYPQDVCLHQLFEEQVERTPDTIALVCGDEQVSHQALDKRANQLAHYLQRQGVGLEVHVGICLERSVALLEGLLGILKADGAYVPLDPTYPQERLAFMLQDADISLVLTQESLLERLPSGKREMVCLDRDRQMITQQDSASLEYRGTAEQLAYVLYTSGSTGQPKAVMVPHRGLVNYLHWARQAYVVPEGSGAPLHSPIGFDLTVTSLFVPLLTGQRVVLLPEDQGIAALGTAVCSSNRFTFVKMTPSHLEALSGYVSASKLAEGAQALIIGGEALCYESLSLWQTSVAQTKLINEYGPTETVVGCCSYEVSNPASSSGAVPIGRPIANMRMYVLNDHLQPVPVGVCAHLYVGGVGVTRGYLNRPDLTAERFIPDPFSAQPGARLYRTGDLARYLPSGDLLYVGRADQQVKLRGYRIELGEIETVLQEHPAIQNCVVLVREDMPGDKRLVAYPVMQGERFTVSDLQSYLQDRLPGYMIPSTFVPLEALPLTPNGKVNRQDLPRPDRVRPDLEETLVLPRTPTEEILAAIWSAVLGIEQVGIHDNFFALGGDSIRSIQVLSQARERGISFSLQQLFQCQTIYELVQVLELESHDILMAKRIQPFSLISPQDQLRLPPDVEDAYPLSMLQAGMIFYSQYSPDSGIYHDIGSYHLQVPFNLQLLQTVIQHLATCYPIMRTAFDLSTFSEPLQLVHQAVDIPLQVADLSKFSPAEQDEMLAAWVEEEKSHPFDWTHAPLLRFQIHLRSESSFQFTLSFHHAILDGWSHAALLTELFEVYLSLLRGEHRSFEPPPAIQFRDFVALERKVIALKEAKQYWMAKLSGSATTALFPCWTAPKQPSDNVSVHVLPVPISQELSAALKKLARDLAVPIKSVLLAAHLRVLSLLSGQGDVLTGLVSNGRPETTDGERILGLFLNTLPFCLKVSGGTWIELIQEAFAAECELLPYRWYPLAEIQRQQGGHALFETAFNFVHFHVYQKLLNASTYSNEFQILGRKSFEKTNFTLVANFFLDLISSDVRLSLQGNPVELSLEQIEAIGGYYSRALTSLAHEPQGRYEWQSLLSTKERHQQLFEWNATQMDYPRDLCVHQLFEQQVAKTPDAVAVYDNERQLTYRELDRWANRVAQHLQKLGVQPEVRVGLCLPRSMELLVSVVGILKAGGAYIPLDPISPQKRLASIVRDAHIAILLITDAFLDTLPEIEQLLSLDTDWAALARYDGEQFPVCGVGPMNLAYVIYTSGSTGHPKGVMISHEGLVHYVRWASEYYGVAVGAGTLLHTSPAFDLTVTSLFSPLVVGRSVWLAAEDASVEELANTFRTGPDFSLVKLTPAHLDLLNQSLAPGELAGTTRTLILGGEALRAESLTAWRLHAPETRLINEYGPTETVVGCCVYEVPGDGLMTGIVPIGRPIANTQIYVLDQQLQPVALGVIGEVYIGGTGLGRGYLDRADLTAGCFVPHPFSSEAGARLYRTGDLARYVSCEGDLEYVGRIDQQVKIRGYRIELGEIETVLAEHPAMQECVVLAREDEPGEKRLVAYAVLYPDQRLTMGDVRNYLQDRLPSYMIPSAFVLLDALPLTSNGKVDRRALPAPSWGGSPDDETFLAPRTVVEKALAVIWAEVLPTREVGIRDNFFELGGDSILSIQVVARAKQRGLGLTVKQLFQHQTIEALSSVIEVGARVQAEQGQAVGSVPLTPIQHWFFDLDLAMSQHWNQAQFLQAAVPLKRACLQQALAACLAHHDSLRLRFSLQDGGWHQWYSAPTEAIPFLVVDLCHLPPQEQDAIATHLSGQTQASLHLSHGPLMRVVLFERGTKLPQLLLMVIHHLVVDSVSWRILLEDVQMAYEQVMQGQAIELPAKTSSFKVWAEHLVQYAQSSTLQQEQSYWLTRTSGQVRPLPVDRICNQQATTEASTGMVWVALSQEGTKALLEEVPAVFHTQINEVLLTALAQTLAEWTGSSSVLVDVEGHGREDLFMDVDISRTMGWFTSLFPVYLDLAGTTRLAQTLQVVKEQLRAIPNHGIGYGILRYLSPDPALREQLGALPAADVCFNYLGQLDQALSSSMLAGSSGLSAGSAHDVRGKRTYLLSITCQVSGNQFRMAWSYSQQVHERATIERVATAFMDALRSIIAHAQSRQAGGYSPSDFPLAGLDQALLDQIIQEATRG